MKVHHKNLIAEATARVREMDVIDLITGKTFPIPLSEQIRHVQASLDAALDTADWAGVADAVVMLAQVFDSRKVNPCIYIPN